MVLRSSPIKVLAGPYSGLIVLSLSGAFLSFFLFGLSQYQIHVADGGCNRLNSGSAEYCPPFYKFFFRLSLSHIIIRYSLQLEICFDRDMVEIIQSS